MKRKSKYFVGCFIAILIPLILVSILITMYYISNRDISFTSEKWENDILKRERMLDDMLDKYDLIGMSYEDVEKILGTNGMQVSKGGNMVYDIGESSLWGTIWFVIELDDKGYVQEYYKHID